MYDFARFSALGIDVQDIHFSRRRILVTIPSFVSRLSRLQAVIPCSAPPPPCAAVLPSCSDSTLQASCSDFTLEAYPYLYIHTIDYLLQLSLAISTAAPAHPYGIRQHTRVFQKRGHCEQPGPSTPPLGECDRLLLRASWPSRRPR